MEPTEDPTPAPVTPEPTENPTPAPVESITTPDPTKDPTLSPVSPSPTSEPTIETTKPVCKFIDVCKATESPSPAPVVIIKTDDPTSSPMTFAPTPCESRFIFIVTVNGDTICSNGNYEKVDSEDVFNNFDDCCDELVDGGFINASDRCVREDICNPTEEPTASPVTSEPTENPTPAPVETITSEPTPAPFETITSPAPTPCEGRKWYSERINGKTRCTNGYSETVGESEIFDTSEECCIATFENVMNCKIVDICNPSEAPTESPTVVTPSPTESGVGKDTPSPTESGNGIDTLSPTEPGEGKDTPSPVTAEPTPEPATPAPTPCEGRKFYEDIIDGLTGCSNEFTYPVDIIDLFDTSKECCDALVDGGFLGADEKCTILDICNPSEAPTVSPTMMVTSGSTPTVGTESESGPTMPPGRSHVCLRRCLSIRILFQ